MTLGQMSCTQKFVFVFDPGIVDNVFTNAQNADQEEWLLALQGNKPTDDSEKIGRRVCMQLLSLHKTILVQRH